MSPDDNALSKLVIASRSDVGRARSENQDAFGELTSSLGERLLVVADGMGGHQGGAQASRHCVNSMKRVFLELEDAPDDRLLRGLEEANADVYQAAADDEDLAGMGATLVALLLGTDGTGWVAWVGDSRLYRLRDGELAALTEDHSLVAQWVKLGVLTPEEAAEHPKRNELTRAVGVAPDVEADLLPVDLRPGDRYLLCSDGLCGVVDEARIAAALGDGEPESAAQALIDLANAAGGPDNVTVQIAWFRDDEAPEEEAVEAPEPEPEAPLELATEAPEIAPAEIAGQPGAPGGIRGPRPRAAADAAAGRGASARAADSRRPGADAELLGSRPAPALAARGRARRDRPHALGAQLRPLATPAGGAVRIRERGGPGTGGSRPGTCRRVTAIGPGASAGAASGPRSTHRSPSHTRAARGGGHRRRAPRPRAGRGAAGTRSGPPGRARRAIAPGGRDERAPCPAARGGGRTGPRAGRIARAPRTERDRAR